MKLTLYGKPGCHLCDDARKALAAVREDLDLPLHEVDVSSDPALFSRYGERIPVLAIDGEDVLELGFDEAAVRRALGKVMT